MLKLLFIFVSLLSSFGSYAVVSYEQCLSKGRIYYCHLPNNDPNKAHAKCSADPSRAGHILNTNCMGGDTNHCMDWTITSPELVSSCGIANVNTSSSLEVCNVGIKHINGREGHIDNDLNSILSSGFTRSTHDYVNFSYEDIITGEINQVGLEAFENSFNSPWNNEISFRRRINDVSFNLSSENNGASIFIDFCYNSNGQLANRMNLVASPATDVLLNTSMWCQFSDSSELDLIPVPLTGGYNSWYRNFDTSVLSPTKCLIRLYGEEDNIDIRNWANRNSLFNIDIIEFNEDETNI